MEVYACASESLFLLCRGGRYCTYRGCDTFLRLKLRICVIVNFAFDVIRGITVRGS